MKKINSWAALVTLAIIVLAGLWWRHGHHSPANVRVGYLPIYVDLPLFVAQEQGFFQKRGINVELVRFASSPDIGTSLVSGDIQAGASLAYAVALSTEVRDPQKLKVFLVDSETPENYLSSFVVLPNSGITSIKDLKGKKLASFPGPTAVTFCKMILEKYGLNPGQDVQIVELDSGTHISALESHTVDALFTYEPIGTQAVLEKGAVKLLAGAVEKEIINPWQAGVWVVTKKFTTENPSQAKQFMLAIYDAVEFLRQNPKQAKIALTKYTSIKPQVAEATPNIPFAKIGEVDLSAFQKHADILHDRGIISKAVDAKTLLIDSGVLSQ